MLGRYKRLTLPASLEAPTSRCAFPEITLSRLSALVAVQCYGMFVNFPCPIEQATSLSNSHPGTILENARFDFGPSLPGRLQGSCWPKGKPKAAGPLTAPKPPRGNAL